MKLLAQLLSIVLLGRRAQAGVDVAVEAGRRFLHAQAAHERALNTAVRVCSRIYFIIHLCIVISVGN